MSKYINDNILEDTLKHAVVGGIFSVVSTLCISIFYIVMYEMLFSRFPKYNTTNNIVIFYIILLVLCIFFIILLKKTNKYKKLFFIISLIICVNLLSLIVIILPNIIFYNMGFETGLANSILFIFIGVNLIFLLSYLMYVYVFDKSVYFNKQLSNKNNLIYIALYIFFSLTISFLTIYSILIYIFG